MILLYLGIATLISGLFFFNRNRKLYIPLLVLFVLVQLSFTVYEYLHLHETDFKYFTVDALGILLLGTLSIISIPAFIHSYIYLNERKDSPKSQSIYYAAISLLITSIGAAYLANHIAVMWIFAEITTLSASALIYHRRNERSLEATWKYVFICSVSITFVFIGILFLSLSLQHAGSDDLSYVNLMANASALNPFWLKLAFLFIFTGFTVKIGLVPMYTVGIDAKDKAPSAAGALFSGVLMNMGFVGIFRIYGIMAQTSMHAWANMILLIAGTLSIFVATVYMTRIKNIKRMFAYSSIEHMGLVTLALAAGGVGYYAAILHIILHAFVKSSLFFQFSQVYRVFRSKSIYDVGNYFKYNTTGALILLLGFLSSTAIPPSGLFVSEFLIFQSMFNARYFVLLGFVLLFLTIIIWGFGKNLLKLLFTPLSNFDESHVEKIKPVESLSQLILLVLAIYLGYNPPAEFVSLIKEAVINLPK